MFMSKTRKVSFTQQAGHHGEGIDPPSLVFGHLEGRLHLKGAYLIHFMAKR